MVRKSETVFKDRIMPLIRQLPWTFVMKIQQVALRGDPDLVLVVKGWPVFIELKRSDSESADPLQRYKLMRAAECGAYSMVLSPESWDECYLLLQKLAAGKPRSKRVVIPESLRLVVP